MGVITALLISGGVLDSKNFVVPVSVVLASAAAIALGTFLGGWRIIKTTAFGLYSKIIMDFVLKQVEG